MSKISRIEIEFAFGVVIESDIQRQIADVIQKICDANTPDECVHWLAGVGSKPLWSQADADFLGKSADPDAPKTGEPGFDDSVLHFETCCRFA